MNARNRFSKYISTINTIRDYFKVTDIQVKEAIDNCDLPQWLKAALLWLVAWSLKRRGYYSFLKAYLSIGGAMLITRPKIWAFLINLFFEENNRIGRFLLSVAYFFDGIIDSIVFWGLTFVVVLVIILHFITENRKREVNKELTELINELSFNPDKDWFEKKCNMTIKTLGNRYSSDINYRNPKLTNVYKVLTNPDVFDWDFKITLQNFIKESRDIFSKLPDEVKKENREIEKKIDDIILIYNNHQDKRFSSLFRHTTYVGSSLEELRFSLKNHNDLYLFEHYSDRLKKVSDYEMMCLFTSYPVLYIKGDAGTGKSHLLADIVSTRMNNGLKSLFALGLDFNQIEDVRDRLLSIWGVKGTWDDFLDRVNKIGVLENHRILIVIDGVNEGRGCQLWPSILQGLEADILSYSNLGLVVSARSFSNTNLLDAVSKGKATITMEGFSGMEDEAMTYMTGKFGVIIPNISQFKKEFSNPLFLKLYCQAYSEKQKKPKSFLDIAENYTRKVNEELAIKYNYQASLYHYSEHVVAALASMYITQDSDYLVKYQRFEDLLSLSETIVPKEIARNFLQDLISEGVLMSYPDHKGEIMVDFNFDLVGDYYCADSIIKSQDDKIKHKTHTQGIYEAACVLLPQIKGVEISEYDLFGLSQKDRYRLFLKTLQQRFTISEDAIKIIYKLRIEDISSFYEILPILSTHPECQELIESFNHDLKMMSMQERDNKWSMFFTTDCYSLSQTELSNLSRWASSISKRSASNMSDIVAFQIASILCWSFSCPYRPLRDTATKAVINVLQDKPNVLCAIIDLFDDVDDPYIQQRLYAVVHGCVFIGECCQSEAIGLKIYEKVFNVQSIRTDILLRDYARCAIDYISQHVQLININFDKIRPPYGVSFNLSMCPDRQTVETRYRLTEDSGYSKQEISVQNAILNSMETEYSNGIGGYGDYGRYIFEASMQGWDYLPDFDASLLRNYALYLIFDKYKFDPRIYKRHDFIVSYHGRSRPILERYGKKYQWIALFEILGLMQDNYLMLPWGQEGNMIQCDGTWDLIIRDIDTTNSYASYFDDVPYLIKEKMDWPHIYHLPIIVKKATNWLNNREGLSKELVRRFIDVKDNGGEEWIVLYGYNTMKQGYQSLDLNNNEIGLWGFLQAYLVPRNQRNKAFNYINKKGTASRRMPEIRNNITELYYKDYYSSPSYEKYSQAYNVDKWKLLDNSNIRFHFSYLPYSHEHELSVMRLNKQLYEFLKLKDGSKIGEYVDRNDILISFDPSVNYDNDTQLLVKKNNLMKVLKQNKLSLVWPVLFEKQMGTHTIGCQFGGSAYLSDDGNIRVKLRFYGDIRKGKKNRKQLTIIKNNMLLLWYTVIANKEKRAEIHKKIKLIKETKPLYKMFE